MADLGRCPLPLCGGLCHNGLVVLLVQEGHGKDSYDGNCLRNGASYHVTQHANPKDRTNRTGKRPQATNRLGNREGVYPNVFTLEWGEFSWKIGLLVAATMIAASEEA